MSRGDCDRRWEVDAYREQRLGDKDAASLERHLRACSGCSERMACDERLRVLGRALPLAEPSPLELRRLRARILRDVATGAGPRVAPRWMRVAVAASSIAAIASAATWAVRGRAPAAPDVAVAAASPAVAELPPALAGSVDPAAGARWAQARVAGVETVTLDDGTLAVQVRHQVPGERFLVGLPDGELEVRGTTFQVTVSAGATSQVHVDEGRVELRLRGRPTAVLAEGETWTLARAPARSTTTGTTSAPAVTGSAAPGAGGDDGAGQYATAIRLLRDGRTEDAAMAFRSFVVTHPRAPQAEDAAFLEGVALARAGRTDAAALAAEHYLSSYPRSFHAKEAAILVARAASQRGDCAAARAALARWPAVDAEVKGALAGCDGP